MPRPILQCLQKLLKTQNVPNGNWKNVGLYFTDNSYREINQEIITFGENLRKSSAEFPIIIISKDENEEEFRKLLSGVSWPAVPFVNITHRVRLHRIYRITSHPSMLIVDWKTGQVICRDAIHQIRLDPQAKSFPWQPKRVADILYQIDLIKPDGNIINYKDIQHGFIGLYFSASWCPPCKAFTPSLISTYEKLKKQSFEIIYVSSDRSVECFESYRKTMPWPAVQFNDDSRRELIETLDIRGIPALVLLNPDLTVVTTHGRSLLREDPSAERYPWISNSVEKFRESHFPVLMERPCLVLLLEDDDGALESGFELLSATAEEYYSQYFNQPPFLSFFVVGEDDSGERLREVADFEDIAPILAVVDITEGLKYQLEEDVQLCPKTVYNFVTRYLKDEIVPISLENPPVQLSSPGS